MNILEIVRNEFLHDLGDDHIAVDHTGTPIARATTREAVEQAAPAATAYFSGAEIAAAAPEIATIETKPSTESHLNADNDTPTTVTEPVEPVEPVDPQPAVAGEGATDTSEQPFDLGIDETPEPPKAA